MSEPPASTAQPGDPYASLLKELRGPVASIQSYVRTLIERDQQLTPAARGTIHQVILQQSQRLDGFLDDVVLYVRLLTGGVVIQREPFLLTGLLEELRHRLGAPQRIAVGVSDDLVLTSDRTALANALRRIMRNALVYGPREGIIRVAAERPAGGVTITVSDSGYGIPQQELYRAFQPFVRAVRAGERRSDGPGLGLSVARELVRAIGGSLELRPGDPGLTVVVRLPG